jgi:hypothetical protein
MLRPVLLFGCAIVGAIAVSCSPTTVFNQQFLDRLNLTSDPTLPAAAEALEIVVGNDIGDPNLEVAILVTFQRSGGGVAILPGVEDFPLTQFCPGVKILRGAEIGRLFSCTDSDAIEFITVGSLQDPDAPGGACVIFGEGGDIFTQLPPFGTVLERGVDFNCGQVIRFSVIPDPAVPGEWRVSVVVFCASPPCGADVSAT